MSENEMMLWLNSRGYEKRPSEPPVMQSPVPGPLEDVLRDGSRSQQSSPLLSLHRRGA